MLFSIILYRAKQRAYFLSYLSSLLSASFLFSSPLVIVLFLFSSLLVSNYRLNDYHLFQSASSWHGRRQRPHGQIPQNSILPSVSKRREKRENKEEIEDERERRKKGGRGRTEREDEKEREREACVRERNLDLSCSQ